jgi:hypothetical protein
MRVTRVSTGLACGLAAILLLGATGAAAVGILLGGQGGFSAKAVPGRGAPRVPGADAAMGRAQAQGHAVDDPRGPSEVLLSLK